MITLFETYLVKKEKQSWKVPSRYLDEFGAALIHIGMSEDEIEFWTSKKRYSSVSNYNHIYIFYEHNWWTWSTSPPTEYDNYHGEIIPTQKDLDEWNLFVQTKKYNI